MNVYSQTKIPNIINALSAWTSFNAIPLKLTNIIWLTVWWRRTTSINLHTFDKVISQIFYKRQLRAFQMAYTYTGCLSTIEHRSQPLSCCSWDLYSSPVTLQEGVLASFAAAVTLSLYFHLKPYKITWFEARFCLDNRHDEISYEKLYRQVMKMLYIQNTNIRQKDYIKNQFLKKTTNSSSILFLLLTIISSKKPSALLQTLFFANFLGVYNSIQMTIYLHVYGCLWVGKCEGSIWVCKYGLYIHTYECIVNHILYIYILEYLLYSVCLKK